MIPTIALESTTTTIGTTATRDQCDGQCIGVNEDTPVEAVVGEVDLVAN